MPVPDNHWVRVSDRQTGVHRTTTRHEADHNSSLTVLKQPATDRNGRPLPPKHKISAQSGGQADPATTSEADKEATK